MKRYYTPDGEPEETEEKTWEGYDKANEEYNGAIYTYIPVIPESEEIPEDTALPENRVLKRVEIEDARMASEITEMLMGSDVPPRRQFIYDHADEAEIDA